MNFRKAFKTESPGFQMAPMIDIVFLLLIFFMVASIYGQWESKIGINVPTADSGVDASRTPGEIIINLDKDGNIFVNSMSFTPEKLQDLLNQIVEKFKGHPVIIRADKETDYKDVITIIDICRKVDIWNISFATLSSESSPR